MNSLIINALKEYSKDVSDLSVKENENLSNHTSFKIGGEAKIFVSPKSIADLSYVIDECIKHSTKWFVLGKGSNVVFSDDGFDGCIISLLSLNTITVDDDLMICESGAQLSKVAIVAKDNSLTGLEFAYGIPGSIGGAVFMNAGAYDGEMSYVVKSSTCLNIDTGEIIVLDKFEHHFAYRNSVFKENSSLIILSTELKLKHGNKNDISDRMETLLNLRKSKQPLEYPSAGSVFKRYPGYYTSQLIDQAGLKGTYVGDAEVSTKHAGFIINKGNATAKDLKALVEIIKKKIYEINGIEMECEILFVD